MVSRLLFLARQRVGDSVHDMPQVALDGGARTHAPTAVADAALHARGVRNNRFIAHRLAQHVFAGVGRAHVVIAFGNRIDAGMKFGTARHRVAADPELRRDDVCRF